MSPYKVICRIEWNDRSDGGRFRYEEVPIGVFDSFRDAAFVGNHLITSHLDKLFEGVERRFPEDYSLVNLPKEPYSYTINNVAQSRKVSAYITLIKVKELTDVVETALKQSEENE